MEQLLICMSLSLIAGLLASRAAKAVRLPAVTSYLVAGLLLGLGSSFTNATTIETYHLGNIIYEGGLLYTILDIMSKAGSAVFDNLALLFAMGVSIGMAKKEKEVAALKRDAAALYKEEQELRGKGDAAYKKAVIDADGALQQKLAAYVEVQKSGR